LVIIRLSDSQMSIANLWCLMPLSAIFLLYHANVVWYFDPLKNRPQGQYTIWYFDPGVDFSSLYFESHHGKLNTLISTISIISIELSIHGTLNPLPMIFWPRYPWCNEPPTHSILIPYSWYIEDPTHGNLTPPPSLVYWTPAISWLEMRRFKIPWWFNLPYRGGSVFNKGV